MNEWTEEYMSKPINRALFLAMSPTRSSQIALACWDSVRHVSNAETAHHIPSKSFSIRSTYKINDQTPWFCDYGIPYQITYCIFFWVAFPGNVTQMDVAFDPVITLIQRRYQSWESQPGLILGSHHSYPNGSHPRKELLGAWQNLHK